MDTLTLILFVIGLVLLVVGAEALVRGASGLAARVGISSLVIGLTVVALGTSSPELAVGIAAAWTGDADIVLGNVVGSNIFNVLFVLGLAALITPLIVAKQLVWLDVPIMVGSSVLLFLLALDGTISRLDGLLLTAILVGYTLFLIRLSRRESAAMRADYEEAFSGAVDRAMPWPLQFGLVLAGLGMLVLGSRWLVGGAVQIAEALGVSDLIIGLTVVAIGTSLPEVATSVVASLRGERDIAVGNVVGSSIFNILAVLGVSSLVAPQGIAVPRSMIHFDLPVAIAVALACLPIFFTGHLIARWEGAVFLAYYVVYTIYLFLVAADHAARASLGDAMITFVLPLTALTLGVLVWRSRRARQLDRGADRPGELA